MKTLKVLVLPVLILALILAGCSGGGSTSNDSSGSANTYDDFIGTWVNRAAINNGYREFFWTFTGNECLFRSVDGNGNLISRLGTFTFTNNQITFIPPPGTWTGYTQRYTLQGNTLTLEEAGQNPSGTFTRPDYAPSRVPTVQELQGRWVGAEALVAGWREYYVEFSGNRLLVRIVDSAGTTNAPGSFTITDTAIIHNIDGYKTVSMPYVFYGDQLWMSNIMERDSAILVKQ